MSQCFSARKYQIERRTEKCNKRKQIILERLRNYEIIVAV